MAKSSTKKVEEPSDEGTGMVRLPNDLVRKISVIAKWKDISVAEFLTPLLRPIVDSEWTKALKEMGQDV